MRSATSMHYNEDKFSVLLTTMDVTLAGDRTFHARPHPIADAAGHDDRPRTAFHGRRLCRRLAVEGDQRRSDRMDGRRPFRPAGGSDADAGQPTSFPTAAASRPTLERQITATISPSRPTRRRRPADRLIAAAPPAQDLRGNRRPRWEMIDLDPSHGESEGARWFMTESRNRCLFARTRSPASRWGR